MKKRDRKAVRNVEVKIREVDEGDLQKVKALIDSATPEAKKEEVEHVRG